MFNRENPVFFWWHSLHKATFFTVLLLVLLGCIVSFSLSYSASEQLGASSMIFFIKHVIFAFSSLIIIITLSTMSLRTAKWLILLGVLAVLAGMAAVLFGSGVKGAKRWLSVAGFTLQPSEFLKPFYIYIVSYLFCLRDRTDSNKPIFLALLFHAVVVGLLFLQPDFGMILTFTVILLALFYLNFNSPKIFFSILSVGMLVLGAVAFFLEHVVLRIKTFFFGLENYQAKLASKAISSGGFLGKGITESQLKFVLPEAHNDFIFAIITEEFGYLFVFALGLAYVFLIFSNFLVIFDYHAKITKTFDENELKVNKKYSSIYFDFVFSRNFIFGACILIFFEFFLNASVSLNLVPTKGIAMPFTSYGGSSLISHGILVGLLLIFNRKRYLFLV